MADPRKPLAPDAPTAGPGARLGRPTAAAAVAAAVAAFTTAFGLPGPGSSAADRQADEATGGATPVSTAWLWSRQVELWDGDTCAAFGGVDLAFVRTELESGYRLRFATARPHRDWTVGNPRVVDIEHDQAVQFDGLSVTLRPGHEGDRWVVEMNADLLRGFRQNVAQSAETARVAGRFPEFARHVQLAMEARLENGERAARHAASWLHVTRLAGPAAELPRIGQPFWIGDPLMERGVFGEDGARLQVEVPEVPGGVEPPPQGSALSAGQAVLDPESLEAYVDSQRAGGRTTDVGGRFEWSLGEPDAEGRRSVECCLTLREGTQRWSLVDRLAPLPPDDPQFAPPDPAVVPGSEAPPGR